MLILRAIVLTLAMACFVLAAVQHLRSTGTLPPVRTWKFWVAAGLVLWVSVAVWDAWSATSLS